LLLWPLRLWSHSKGGPCGRNPRNPRSRGVARPWHRPLALVPRASENRRQGWGNYLSRKVLPNGEAVEFLPQEELNFPAACGQE